MPSRRTSPTRRGWVMDNLIQLVKGKYGLRRGTIEDRPHKTFQEIEDNLRQDLERDRRMFIEKCKGQSWLAAIMRYLKGGRGMSRERATELEYLKWSRLNINL